MKAHIFCLAITILASFLASTSARAAGPQFVNLTQDDVDKITRDFSSNTSFHSVLPPSTLGSIFGFELGIVGGVTKSPNIDEASKRVDASASIPQIPHAGFVGAVTTPIALTGEAFYLPKFDNGDFKYSQYGLSLKWTLSDSILPIPLVNIALRGFLAKSEFSFKQNYLAQSMTVSASNQVTGLQLLVSPKLIPILEPYVGVGMVSGKGTISHDAPIGSIFAGGGNEASSSPASGQLIVGLDARLLLIGLGVEYSKEFGNDSLTGKLSFKF